MFVCMTKPTAGHIAVAAMLQGQGGERKAYCWSSACKALALQKPTLEMQLVAPNSVFT